MKRFLWVLVLSLFVVSSAFGFNGVRKGFVLGGGLGLGMISFSEKFSDPFSTFETDRENKFAFMTDFKIGYAPTNQVEVVYSSKVAWFSAGATTSATFAHAISTAAVNYYIKPEGPSFFVSGGLGFAGISAPFDENAYSFDDAIGFGFYIGGGYEFVKHFAVALDFLYGLPKDEQLGVDYTLNAFTPRLTIIATAF